MYIYRIIGQSNIGNKIEQYLNKDIRFKEDKSQYPDIVFLVGSKESVENIEIEKYPNAKIVDVSSHKRLSSNTNFVDSGNDIVYGIPHLTKYYNHYNYVSNPGCSAIGVLTALHPIIDYLKKNIILDVKFSKSSLTRKSSFNDKKDIMTVVHPFKHTHQKEIKYYFGGALNIKMVPSIIDVPNGTNINIYAFKNKKSDNLLNTLAEFYRDNEEIIILEKGMPELKDVISTNKIIISVVEEGKNIFINVVLDNLTVGGAYTAYQNGLKILGED